MLCLFEDIDSVDSLKCYISAIMGRTENNSVAIVVCLTMLVTSLLCSEEIMTHSSGSLQMLLNIDLHFIYWQ